MERMACGDGSPRRRDSCMVGGPCRTGRPASSAASSKSTGPGGAFSALAQAQVRRRPTRGAEIEELPFSQGSRQRSGSMAWATESLFGIFGGKGDPRKVRQHLKNVQAQLAFAELESEKIAVQKRIGRLLGGTAILRVGGMTETERTNRKETASRAIGGLRSAMGAGL